jgi:hypothetical protein
VKGVAEREARADLAIWPLRLVVTGDDLAAANTQLAADAGAVRTFLDRQGLGAGAGTDVTVQDFTVTDARSNQGSYAPGSRFVIRQTIIVRSTDVARVQAAAQRVADLVQAGVVLSSGQEYGGGPTFLFTRLDALKAPMIAKPRRRRAAPPSSSRATRRAASAGSARPRRATSRSCRATRRRGCRRRARWSRRCAS